jgi:DNA (cytosine-5)-methyltransferase 1
VVVDRGQIKKRDLANTLDSNYWKGIDNHQQRTGIIENLAIRRLTPLECERLQGFPDGWTEGVSDTQRYKMLGNAVTTNVVRAIGERL